MIKIIFAVVGLFIFVASANSVEDVREVARDWAVASINVGTQNVTALYAGTTQNLSGRYRIVIENIDGFYDVALGTHSSFTYGNGWVLKSTNSHCLSSIDLPLPSGTTVYGRGQANAVSSSVTVKVIEFK